MLSPRERAFSLGRESLVSSRWPRTINIVKSWDAIVVGAGVIGLAVARELRKHGASVLVVERAEPGREASHAAAGMLADADPELKEPLKSLAVASARLYPEFALELEDESGVKIDLRRQGTIGFFPAAVDDVRWKPLPEAELRKLEPKVESLSPAYFAEEASVDPRALGSALVKAARHRGVDIAAGSEVEEVVVENGRAAGVKTARARYAAAAVLNCAGAWAGKISAAAGATTVKPMKGQMLAVIGHGLLQHVVRAPEVYLVPRSDGRLLIGATVEDVGYDKRVLPDTIQHLHQAAAKVMPEIGEAKIHEAWAGLRPGTADGMPLIGASAIDGYFLCAGHYRDGILLTPISARLMAQLVRGIRTDFPLEAFSPARFG